MKRNLKAIFLILAVLLSLASCKLADTGDGDSAHTHPTVAMAEENQKDPTCTTAGSYDVVTYCTECSAELCRESKALEKLAHTAGEAVRENEVAASCASAGTYDLVTYCTACTLEMSRESITIEKLTHTESEEVRENEIAAGCTENGSYDVVIYCTECDAEISRNTVSVPAGHTYESGVCTSCGESLMSYNRDGDYIYFGEFPQTLKADDVEITATVDERGYYLGDDGFYYARVVADIWNSTFAFSNGEASEYGETYYFKVEPIRWRILTEENGEALILCDSMITAMAYQHLLSASSDANGDRGFVTSNGDAPTGTYANNYKYSTVRDWLNKIFYETAFNELQRELILTTTVDNSAASTGKSKNPYACENTDDKIFLLSLTEASNPEYGFNSTITAEDVARVMSISDYALAHGATSSMWLLRSPNPSSSYSAYHVTAGAITTWNLYVFYERGGVVPALRIKL